MLGAPRPTTEQARLASLESLRILDTSPEERFDRVTRIAQRMFNVPIALVSFVDRDRQWFKSHQGLDAAETPRDQSFCAYAILEENGLTVTDALRDARFVDNPLVTGPPGIRFYAGAVIRAPDGQPIGTFCIIDTVPRTMSPEDTIVLNDLAHVVEREINMFELATLDALTGLLNRTGFLVVASHFFKLADRLRGSMYVAYCDVDHLKRINDQYGHGAGDRMLVNSARALRAGFRDSDVVARVGGDEFCAIVRAGTATDIKHIAARIEQETKRLNASAPNEHPVAMSIGWAQYEPGSAVSVPEMMDRADRAMYVERQQRRSGACS